MKLDKTIGYQIKSVWHNISKMYNKFAEDHQLTFTMALVLLQLETNEGLPSTQIGPSVGLEARSLTRLLKRMEDEGLVEKSPSKEDKRLVYISLTEKGKEKRQIAKARINDFDKQIQESIGKDELAIFANVLKKIKTISKLNLES